MNLLFRFRRPAATDLPKEETGSYMLEDRKVSYVIQRKSRRRGISFYIETAERLRFVTPLRTRTQRITDILDQRGEWIARKLDAIRRLPPAPGVPAHFKDGETTYYLGAPYKLRIVENSSLGCRIEGEHLDIHLVNAENTEHEARLELLLWYKKQAKQVLKERTDYWADRLQLKYRSMKVGNPLRQWGSCSAKNDIRYNWRVILAPLEAVDYLVAHELCHIVHKNHSPRFWNLLATVMPDHKERRKILHAMDAGFSL